MSGLLPGGKSAHVTEQISLVKLVEKHFSQAHPVDEANLMPPTTRVGTIDRSGRFSPSPSRDASPSVTLLPAFVVLPDHPVHVGDSWNLNSGAGNAPGLRGTLTYTLVRSSILNGRKASEIRITGKSSFAGSFRDRMSKSDRVEFDKASKGPSEYLKYEFTYAGLGWVDQETGRTLRQQVQYKGRTWISRSKTPMASETTYSLTLKGF